MSTGSFKHEKDKKKAHPFGATSGKELLSGFFLYPDRIKEAIEIIDKQCFEDVKDWEIFKAMKKLEQNGQTVDLITVAEQLKNDNKFEVIGGAPYIVNIINEHPVAKGF